MSYKFTPTHYGSFLGVPAFIDMTDDECPAIEARYHLGFLMDAMEFLFGIYCSIACFVNPDFEPMFPILIKGEWPDKDAE